MDDGSLTLPAPVAVRPFTSLEFQDMVEAGVFAEAEGKVELDGGSVIVSPMDGGPHLNVGQRIGGLWWPVIKADPILYQAMRLFIPGAIRVTEGVTSAPDAMLAPPQTVGKGRWPTAQEAFLAIEFSDTTLAYDDGRKKANYAKGGLAELWIVRINEEDVRVCRGPQPDGSWAQAELLRGEAMLTPLAAPALGIRVQALFED